MVTAHFPNGKSFQKLLSFYQLLSLILSVLAKAVDLFGNKIYSEIGNYEKFETSKIKNEKKITKKIPKKMFSKEKQSLYS